MNRRADLASAAPLTVLFLAINLVLYGVSALRSGDISRIDSDVLVHMGGSIREGLWNGEWYRLIAPNFLHAGLLHILMNGMSLYSLGPSAEVHFGSSNYGTLYIVSGVTGFCFSQILGGTLSIGASCSLFGILGALFAVQVLSAPVLANAWRSSGVRRMFFFCMFYLAIGFTRMLGPIDNWGHLGGFLSGILLGGFFELWRRRRNLGIALIVAVLLLEGGVICAARWSIFNPYYHVHAAATADEQKQSAEAQREWAEAHRWAKFWNMERKTELLRLTHAAGLWKMEEMAQWGYSLKNMADVFDKKSAGMSLSEVEQDLKAPPDQQSGAE